MVTGARLKETGRIIVLMLEALVLFLLVAGTMVLIGLSASLGGWPLFLGLLCALTGLATLCLGYVVFLVFKHPWSHKRLFMFGFACGLCAVLVLLIYVGIHAIYPAGRGSWQDLPALMGICALPIAIMFHIVRNADRQSCQ